MKLLVFSDLHTEHKPDWKLPDAFPDYDVCVAAGDIAGSPAAAIRLLAEHPVLHEKPIIYVAGNHEFYSNVYEDAIAEGKVAAVGTGVHFLDGDSVIIGDTRFAGGILWTDFALDGNRALGLDAAARGMNDFRYIKRRAYTAGQPGKWRFLPKDAAWHHERYRAAIERILAEPHDGPTVVVTHHAPSRQSIDPRNIHDRTNVAYASDLEGVMTKWKPAMWVHGHVHVSVDYVIGETSVRSNPKGYGPNPREGVPFIQNPKFDPQLIIEVPKAVPKDEPGAGMQP